MELKPIWSDVKVADLFTLLNALLGIAAIVVAAAGEPQIAAMLVLAAILVDGADGAAARLGFGGSAIGAHLDTLADALTFVAAPAVILMLTHPDAAGLAAGAIVASAGLLRLARFEALRGTLDPPYFFGLSSPGGAIFVVAPLLSPILAPYAPIAAAVGAGLMVARMRLPKLRGAIGLLGALLILVVLTSHGQPWQEWAAWLVLLGTLVYIVLGPAYVERKVDSGEPTSSV